MHVAILHGANPIPGMADAAFDLSEFVRIGRDEGLVVDDIDFLTPQFGDTPLAEGQPLLSVTAGLQEKAYALGLNDVGPREAVELQQALTWHVGQNGPLVLEEKQEGGFTTYRDVVFARFEPNTNVHQARRGWRIGVLRIWTAPYATTGTSRLVATAVATNAFVVQFPAIGGLEGDVPALLDVSMVVAQASPIAAVVPGATNRDGRFVAVAALPHPSYAAFHGPGQFDLIDASATHSVAFPSRADGDMIKFLGLGAITTDKIAVPFAARSLDAAVYQGRSRVLAVGQARAWGGAFRAFDTDGQPIGGTAIASAGPGQWTLLDLGVLNIPSGAATARITIEGGLLATTGYYGGRRLNDDGMYFGGMVLLPEDRSAIVIDSKRRPAALYISDQGASGPLGGQVDMLGNTWATATTGLWALGAPSSSIIPYQPSLTGYQRLFSELPLVNDERDLRIEAQLRLGSAGSQVINLYKWTATDSYVRGGVGRNATSGVGWSDLEVVSNATRVAYASTAYGSGNTDAEVELEIRGPFAKFGTLTASAAAVAKAGHPALSIQASVTATAIPNWPAVLALRAGVVPSQPMQPSQIYHFDGPAGQAERLSPSGDWQAALQPRGQVPLADVPTCHGLAAVCLALSAETTKEITNVDVRVRERFTFLR